ncbi:MULTISPECIES: hypothetical protein [Nostocales]|uniref:Uncharacterized protein n=3 Tax=Nostocales TaxID=1161 RepID=A0A8S9TCH3_9CYAN|nr:hypothetical protein [Tolypothrix bouteillei]KAF3889717.1 hypothetical protein DA73_0400032780 [Tolypothrix bouteillei VB521301]
MALPHLSFLASGWECRLLSSALLNRSSTENYQHRISGIVRPTSPCSRSQRENFVAIVQYRSVNKI